MLGRRDGASMLVAAIISALCGFGVLVVAAQVLSPARNADFLVFWGVLFSIFSALFGVQGEVTRSVSMSRSTRAANDHQPRLLPLLLGCAAVVSVVVAAIAPLAMPHLLGARDWKWETTLLVVAIPFFAVHVGIVGALGGARQWRASAGVIGFEAALRLTLVVALALTAGSVVALAAGAALATSAWVFAAAASREVRSTFSLRTDVPTQRFIRQLGLAAVSSGASGLLIVGFPVLLRLATTDATFASAAPIILAVSMTRAPIMIVVGVLQSAAIAYFIEHRDAGLGPLRRTLGSILLLGLAATFVATAIGPFVLGLVQSSYRISHVTFGILTLDAVLLGMTSVTSAACIAASRHAVAVAGWLVAGVVTFGLLHLPGSLDSRVVIACAVGPVLGGSIHLAALRRPRSI